MNRRIAITTLVLTLVSAAIGAYFYRALPDPVPTHFDLAGRPNGFTSKPLGVFLPTLFIAPLGLFLAVIPKISPRGYQVDAFKRVYEIISLTTLGFLFVISALAFSASLGHPWSMDHAILPLVGLLLLILGNFMGKTRRNFFVGIRTPWTLADDEVWLRTHRLGGPLFVLGGAIVMVGGLFGADVRFLLAVVLTIAFVPVVYSYVIYRRLTRQAERSQ